MNRLNIVVGHFGSGKTEFAINLAIKQETCYNKRVIVDMDIVNPYFRTKDAKQDLIDAGVSVIAPEYASTNVDIPALPPQIYSVFQDKEFFAVLDVGGDEDGASVLGRYHPYLEGGEYTMYFVINARRPLTSNAQEVMDMMEQVQRTSRLKITDLVNNTNLSYSSTVEDLLYGQTVAEEVAAKTGLPLSFICGRQAVLDALPPEISTTRFPLDLKMKLPFEVTDPERA